MLDCLKDKKNYEVKHDFLIIAFPYVPINEFTLHNILYECIDTSIDGKVFVGCDFDKVNFSKDFMNMQNVSFKRCILNECIFNSMHSCRFTHCNLVNCVLNNISINSTYFELSNIFKCDFSNSVFKESGITLCNFNDNKVCNSEMNGLFIDYSDIRNNDFETVKSIYRTKEKPNNDPHLISW